MSLDNCIDIFKGFDEGEIIKSDIPRDDLESCFSCDRLFLAYDENDLEEGWFCDECMEAPVI